MAPLSTCHSDPSRGMQAPIKKVTESTRICLSDLDSGVGEPPINRPDRVLGFMLRATARPWPIVPTVTEAQCITRRRVSARRLACSPEPSTSSFNECTW
jgi:hypothetical protein